MVSVHGFVRHTHYQSLREEDVLWKGRSRGDCQHDPFGKERRMTLITRIQRKPDLEKTHDNNDVMRLARDDHVTTK